MASVTYYGSFGTMSGVDGLTSKSTSYSGTPLSADSVITSVRYTLAMTANTYSSSYDWEMDQFAVGGSGGSPSTWNSSATMYGTSHTFEGALDFSAADSLQFRGTSLTVYAQAKNTHPTSKSFLEGWSVTVEYVTPTACSAPTTVAVSSDNVSPGAKITLSWSGASAGADNAITGYQIYRSTSPDSGYSLLTAVGSATTSGSATVSAPTNNSATYYYKVVTVGSRSGYNSSQSTAYASLTCSYAAVSAPTTLKLNLTNVAPGASATLSWSGASGGDNNAIAGYEVYRATSADGEYTLLTTVTSSATSGSTTVTAPSTNGSTYYYKVRTLGTLNGSHSAMSSTYTSLGCTYSAPNAPSKVTVGGETTTYAKPGVTVTLAWSGASAGANNPIKGYDIYRDGTLYVSGLSASTSTRNVSTHTTAGNSYKFSVVTKGEHSDSAQSAEVTLHTYTDPVAPTTVSVSNATPFVGARVLLSWSGAESGGYNDIVGYRVYRSTTDGGSVTQVAAVEGNSSSGSCYVPAPSSVGATYYYRVETVGSYSSSGVSTVYAVVGAVEAAPDDGSAVEVIVAPPARRAKRGFILGGYDTAFKGWTLTGWEFPEPDEQTKYVEVPGRIDGPLDRSTALTGGDPRFGSRTLTLTLEHSDGTRDERIDIISEMVNLLHGRREEIIFPDDPARYAVGRLHVQTEYNDMAHAAVTVTAVCEPWRYNREETRVSLLAIEEDSTVVLFNSGRKVIVPDVVVSGYGASVRLSCAGRNWTLGVGTYRLPELTLPTGNTILTYRGTGTVNLTYREARL